MKLLACYTIKVHTWPEATLFNSDNLCIKPYRERRHRSSSSSSAYGQNSNFNKLKTPDQSRSVEILGMARHVTAWDRRIKISNVPSETRSAEGWCLGQWLLFPQIWSQNRAQVPLIFGLMFPPLSGSTPFLFPFGLRSCPISPPWPYPPLFLPLSLYSVPSSHSCSFLFFSPTGPTPS